jgi:beta-galactosidase GanA
MGGNAYQTVTTMSGNTTSYTWYQMKGVSGNVTYNSNHGEITFKTGYVAGTSAVTGKVAHLEGWAVNY